MIRDLERGNRIEIAQKGKSRQDREEEVQYR